MERWTVWPKTQYTQKTSTELRNRGEWAQAEHFFCCYFFFHLFRRPYSYRWASDSKFSLRFFIRLTQIHKNMARRKMTIKLKIPFLLLVVVRYWKKTVVLLQEATRKAELDWIATKMARLCIRNNDWTNGEKELGRSRMFRRSVSFVYNKTE